MKRKTYLEVGSKRWITIFSTSPPHIHGFHGNLSDSPLAALELYVKKDKTLIFR